LDWGGAKLERDNLSYFAGLLDGEGSVGFFSHGKGRPLRFVLEITMTSPNVIQWLYDNFGGSIMEKPPRKEGYKPAWRWYMYGDKAIELYRLVNPLLLVKQL
jgi:hypothetical protein